MHEQPSSQERKHREIPPPELPSQALEHLPTSAMQAPDSREELARLSHERAELREELSILNGAIRMRRPNLEALKPEHPMSLKKGPNTALSPREYADIWEAKETIEARLKSIEEHASELERAVYTPQEIAELREIETILVPEEVPEELSRYATKEVGPRAHPFTTITDSIGERSISNPPVRWYANFVKLGPRLIHLAAEGTTSMIGKVRAFFQGRKSTDQLEGEQKQLPAAPPEQENQERE